MASVDSFDADVVSWAKRASWSEVQQVWKNGRAANRLYHKPVELALIRDYVKKVKGRVMHADMTTSGVAAMHREVPDHIESLKTPEGKAYAFVFSWMQRGSQPLCIRKADGTVSYIYNLRQLRTIYSKATPDVKKLMYSFVGLVVYDPAAGLKRNYGYVPPIDAEIDESVLSACVGGLRLADKKRKEWGLFSVNERDPDSECTITIAKEPRDAFGFGHSVKNSWRTGFNKDQECFTAVEFVDRVGPLLEVAESRLQLASSGFNQVEAVYLYMLKALRLRLSKNNMRYRLVVFEEEHKKALLRRLGAEEEPLSEYEALCVIELAFNIFARWWGYPYDPRAFKDLQSAMNVEACKMIAKEWKYATHPHAIVIKVLDGDLLIGLDTLQLQAIEFRPRSVGTTRRPRFTDETGVDWSVFKWHEITKLTKGLDYQESPMHMFLHLLAQYLGDKPVYPLPRMIPAPHPIVLWTIQDQRGILEKIMRSQVREFDATGNPELCRKISQPNSSPSTVFAHRPEQLDEEAAERAALAAQRNAELEEEQVRIDQKREAKRREARRLEKEAKQRGPVPAAAAATAAVAAAPEESDPEDEEDSYPRKVNPAEEVVRRKHPEWKIWSKNKFRSAVNSETRRMAQAAIDEQNRREFQKEVGHFMPVVNLKPTPTEEEEKKAPPRRARPAAAAKDLTLSLDEFNSQF